MPRAPRSFFEVPAERLAPRLIGCTLVRMLDGERLAGRIVEVEAYSGVKDTASHAYNGRRGPKNEAMYARAGTAYVYFTYGMHFCFNVVCGAPGEPVAVLVRALEPVEGHEAMRAARAGSSGRAVPDRGLCSGPGKLCQALAIDRALDGADLLAPGALELHRGEAPARIVRAQRVGVGEGHRWAAARLRWYEEGSPHVSVLLKS